MVRRGTERVLVRSDSRGEMVGMGSTLVERKVVEGGRGGEEMFQSLMVLSENEGESEFEARAKGEKGRKGRERERTERTGNDLVSVFSRPVDSVDLGAVGSDTGDGDGTHLDER